MGGEKKNSKSGRGYVGGFLQLFDWNAKSRKKLFPSDSEFTERSKRKKRSDGNLPRTRLQLMDDDEIVAGSSIKGSSDYSCASSVTDEDVSRTRPPGVVARLMGLDSLPTSNSLESYSTPFLDSQSLRDAHYLKRNIEFHHDHQTMHSGHVHNKVDVPARNAQVIRPQKMAHRPIEKFQSEILPPKSAKSIPITQHKLLSPIKSPNFIPTQNVAHLMEAAAKIIDPGSQAITKAKLPLVASSSVPFKVRDLKEKMEASQKPPKLAEGSRRQVDSDVVKYLKGQSLNKNWIGSVDRTSSFTVSSHSENCSSGRRNNGKSISLALQAKFNVQKRECLNMGSGRSPLVRKEDSEVLSNQPTNQKNTQKSAQKKPSTSHASTVLRQNNQKQNCLKDKGKSPAKALAPANLLSRKALSGDSSIVRQRGSMKSAGNSRVGSRRLDSEVSDGEKEVPHTSIKNSNRKKRSVDGNFHAEKCEVIENILVDENQKPIHSNGRMGRHFSTNEDNKRKGMDVISFTFTAPMAWTLAEPETTTKEVEKSGGFAADCRNKRLLRDSDGINGCSVVSSSQYNMIGGDPLSTLLEQKLRELTLVVESSQHKIGTGDSSASSFQDFVNASNPMVTTPITCEEWRKEEMYRDQFGNECDFAFFSADPHGLLQQNAREGMEEVSACDSNDIDSRKLLGFQHPSPMSVLEPSYFTESCNSSDTMESCTTEGSKLCSSVQAQEVLSVGSSRMVHLMEVDPEFSDSASSTSVRTHPAKVVTALSLTDSEGSSKCEWELEYVKEILFNVDLTFSDFAWGKRAKDIINPYLFYQMESQKGTLENRENGPKLRRKVIFDCVNECVGLRCRHYTSGGFQEWEKGLSVMRRKDRLAEEVYRDISGWQDMGDSMVDELVDRDMSGQYGRWLDFEVEGFELGVEIEGRILNTLLDEVITDILPP